MLAPCTGHVPHGVGPHPRSESGQHCWSPAQNTAHQACHIVEGFTESDAVIK